MRAVLVGLDLDASKLALLGILCAVLHWILARSRIFKPIWSRARGLASDLLRCAGCCGLWFGIGLGILGLRPVTTGLWIADVAMAALLAVFATPVAEGVLVWGLAASRIEDDPGSDPGPDLPAS